MHSLCMQTHTYSGLKIGGSDDGANDSTPPVCVRAAFTTPVDTTGANSRKGECKSD